MPTVLQGVAVSSDKTDHCVKEYALSHAVAEEKSTDGRKRKRERTPEEKKLDRIMANRRSARESRERRKMLMENMENSVKTLQTKNDELEIENQILRQRLSTLTSIHAQCIKANSHVSAIPSNLNPLPTAGTSGVTVRAPVFRQAVAQTGAFPAAQSITGDAKGTLLLASLVKSMLDSKQHSSLLAPQLHFA